MNLKKTKLCKKKLQVICEFESPKNRTDLQKFFGICTYRHFTVRHANLIQPFRDILKSKNPWKWDEGYERAFDLMKNAFLNCVRLTHHIREIKYRLQTDASDVGISGILYQLNEQEEC